LVVLSGGDESAVFEDVDEVGVHDGGESVCDDEDGVRYAVAVMANNYTGGVLSMRQAIEYLLVDVFE